MVDLTINKDDLITILGSRGYGKTYFSIYLMENLNYKWLILDSTGAYLKYKINNGIVKIVDPYDPDNVNSLIKYAIKNNLNLCIDEIDEFPYKKYAWLRGVVMRGRNWGIGFIGISRMPALVHKSIIGNSNFIITFHIHEVNALKYLSYFLEKVNDIAKLQKHEFFVYNDLGERLNEKPMKISL